MPVTPFNKTVNTYILIVALNDNAFHVIRGVEKHIDVTSMEYFPTLSVFTNGKKYPVVFNWNEIRFYWEADNEEATTLETEIEAAQMEWHKDTDDETPH